MPNSRPRQVRWSRDCPEARNMRDELLHTVSGVSKAPLQRDHRRRIHTTKVRDEHLRGLDSNAAYRRAADMALWLQGSLPHNTHNAHAQIDALLRRLGVGSGLHRRMATSLEGQQRAACDWLGLACRGRRSVAVGP
jgi:hypothetical protein